MQDRGPGRGRVRRLESSEDTAEGRTRLAPRRMVVATEKQSDEDQWDSASCGWSYAWSPDTEEWAGQEAINANEDTPHNDDGTPHGASSDAPTGLIRLAAACTALAFLPGVAAVPPPMPSPASARRSSRPTGRAHVRDRRRSEEERAVLTSQGFAPLCEDIAAATPTTTPSSLQGRYVEQQQEDPYDTLFSVATASYSNALSQLTAGTATSSGRTAHVTCPPISTVDETALPYYITQGPDGHWTKADAGWVLFGRGTAAIPVATAAAAEAPSSTSTDASASAAGTAMAASDSATPTYDVTSALPKGWGQTSDRGSLYAVPLIVVSSVVLAALITAFIAFIVISRVKHRQKMRRRRKRREEERRVKMLAAGLDPDEDGEGGEPAAGDGAASPRGSMDSRRSRGSQAARPQSIAAAIVTGRRQLRGSGLGGNRIQEWRKGLRRRKGGKVGRDQEDTPNAATPAEEDETGNTTNSPTIVEQSEADPTGSTTSPELLGTDTITEETLAGSDGVDPGSSAAPPPNSPQPPTTLNLTRGEIEQVEQEAEAHASAPPPIHGGMSTFLPAYRAAPVYAAPTAGHSPPPISVPSRHLEQDVAEALAPYTPRAGDSAEGQAGPSEKSGRPGYYPAPTTIEQEEAVAIASASGAQPEAEVTSGHVATDDKRVLQRLMQNASSAPAVERHLHGESSAPVLDVDEDGFERMDLERDEASEGPSAPSILPAPPKPVLQSAPSQMPLMAEMDAFSTPAETPSALHMASEPEWHSAAHASAPSAPELDDEDDTPTTPSAPPMEGDD